MGIISKIKTEQGIECSYSKINRVVYSANKLEIVLDVFVSKEARDENKYPIKTLVYLLFVDDAIQEISKDGMNHLKYAYDKLIETSNLALVTEEENSEIFEKYMYLDKTYFPFIGDE